uniref:ABC2_membrane domain-containing protein n=1 Tax=Panagrellus redivivus TaxID=6233 RepID=A0A7E4VRY2_PANRE
MGSPRDILGFFDSLELVCPSDYNPADYIIDVLAVDHQNGNADAALDRIQRVCKAFMESPQTSEFYQKLLTYDGFSKGEVKPRQRASFFSQFRLILKRSMIDNKRNPSLARAKMIQKIVMGLFVGLLYLRTSMTEVGIANINGALFYLVAELTYSTLFGILTFMPNDFPLVVREHFDGLYSVSAYYFARVLSYMPVFIIDGFVMMTVSYWMIGLTPNVLNYIVCIGIAILVEQSASAFGVMLSTCAPSYSVAISIAGPVLTVMSLTGGLLANVGEIPVFIRWTQYLSWFKYGFEAMAINQWRGMSNNTCIGETCRTSDEILERYAFDASNFWIDILAMFAFVIGYYIIGYIGMYIRVHRNR